jgi:hypothetical protein
MTHSRMTRTVHPCTEPPLPAGLDHARNLSLERQLTKAQAAEAELAQIPARPSAQLAAIVLAAGKLRLSCVFDSLCCCCHCVPCNPLSLGARWFRALAQALASNFPAYPALSRYAVWRKGMPNCRSNARAELSSLAVVTIVIFMPFSFSTRA